MLEDVAKIVPPNRYVYGEVLFTLYFLQFFQC